MWHAFAAARSSKATLGASQCGRRPIYIRVLASRVVPPIGPVGEGQQVSHVHPHTHKLTDCLHADAYSSCSIVHDMCAAYRTWLSMLKRGVGAVNRTEWARAYVVAAFMALCACGIGEAFFGVVGGWVCLCLGLNYVRPPQLYCMLPGLLLVCFVFLCQRPVAVVMCTSVCFFVWARSLGIRGLGTA